VNEAPPPRPASIEPAAQPPRTSPQRVQAHDEAQPGADSFAFSEADLDQALDAAFGEDVSVSVAATSTAAEDFDRSAVRELYAGIAAQHAGPVRNLIFELKRGTATKEWIEICRPVMATLIRTTEASDLIEESNRMADFDKALSQVSKGEGILIDPATRDLILSRYDAMAKALPEAFLAGEEEQRREAIIIHSLLKQVPDVGHVTFQRLYGAGLTTLESLFQATKEDLAVTSGIPEWLAEKICERVQEYWRQLRAGQQASGMSERRHRLRKLLNDMRNKHEAYERASVEEWSNPSLTKTKREFRQARQVCALEIEMVLVDMGELELVEQVQRMPFGQRMAALERFISDAGRSAAGA
jgi:hypothetical protein